MYEEPSALVSGVSVPGLLLAIPPGVAATSSGVISLGQALRGAPSAASYVRRDPREGPLHQLLSATLPSYIEQRRERPLAPFVQKALSTYLKCGDLWHGFARFKCEDCPHSLLVALSCKQRAFCPRCGGRRMAAQAKHLLENVLPPVPFRQWVLTLPFELRWRMAFDHDLALGVWGVARRAIDTFYRTRTRRSGPSADMHPGSIMAIQRFGSALNLNVHFHALYIDGAFVERSDGELVFVEAPTPDVEEIETLTLQIRRRIERLLQRRGLGPDADADEGQLPLPGMQAAYTEGVTNKGAWQVRTEEPREPSRYSRLKANVDGVDLDAHVTVGAAARDQLERLTRYILRPAIKEERLKLVGEQVRLELKAPWRNGTTHVSMSAHTFVDRLATLVPPPRVNTLLYGGVLAANARLRAKAVAHTRPGVQSLKLPAKPRRSAKRRHANPAWAELMRHSFGLDVLACTQCGGRLRHIATIMSRVAIRKILLHQGHVEPQALVQSARGSPDVQYEPDPAALAAVDLVDEW